jgi:hypothetical protein
MRTRILITTLALIATACGGAATETTSTTGAPAPSATAPTTTAASAETALYAYSYAPGDSYSYDLALDQHVTMNVSTEGDEALIGATDAPGNVDVHTSVSGSLAYDVSEGPESGTTALHISGVFDDLTVEGTIDGQPATTDDLQSGTVPDLIEVPDTTIILDQYGHPVSVDGTDVSSDQPFFGDPFALVGGLTSGGLNQPFGPEFPDHPLAVGDTWTQEVSQDIPDSDQTVTTSVTYTVSGMDTVDGHDVAVIDFTATASGVDIDLGEMFQALLEGFGSMAESDSTTTTEVPTIDFVISLGDSDGSGTYWFDQEAGIVRKVHQTYTVPMTMHMAVDSSEGSGSTDVQMSIETAVDASLAGSGTAG